MNKSKKVLIIEQTFPPDLTASGFRNMEMGKHMVEAGYEVHVLAAEPHRDRQASHENARQMIDDRGLHVVRSPILERQGDGLFWYLLHFLSFMCSSFLWGVFWMDGDYDAVIASTPPIFVACSAWLISLIKRARFVYQVRDIWPESAVGAGKLERDSLPFQCAKILEKFLYNRPDLVTCVSERMKQYISDLVPSSVPVEVIYNGIDPEYLQEDEQTDDPVSFPGPGTDQATYITYAGNLGTAQGLEVVVEAAEELESTEKGEVHFVLVGGGVCREDLEKQVKHADLENVHFTGAVERTQAFSYLAGSDAVLVHLRDEQAFRRTIPSKVFDYLYVNRPIFYGIEGEGRDVLSRLEGNLYFEPENSGALVESVETFLAEKQQFQQKAQENRSFVMEHFSRRKMSHTLMDAVERIDGSS